VKNNFSIIYRCLHYFSTNEKLQSHVMDCQKINDSAIQLPSSWTTSGSNLGTIVIRIASHSLSMLTWSVFYGKQNPTGKMRRRTCINSMNTGYYVHCSYDDTLSSYPSRWRLYNVVRTTTPRLGASRKEYCIRQCAHYTQETLSKQQWEVYRNATRCHICEKPFASDKTRVRDHLTGRYRDPTHSNCNLNYKNSLYIPIVFHNLSATHTL